MSVYRRPNGRWCAQVYDPGTGRPRQVGTYDTRREAQRAELDAMDRRAASGRETVQSFAGRWMADYPRPRESTRRHNAERVKAFAAEHGKRRMDSIDIDTARRWANEHPAQLSALRAMFNDARRSGVVVVNPFTGLGIERSRGRRDLPSDWLTAEDVDRLADVARAAHGDYGPTMAGVVLFAAYTGVRPGELFALERGDLGAHEITIRRSADSKTRTVGPTKNGRPREIVYPAKAREAVEGALNFGGPLVFTSPRGGQLWASSFSWLWKPVKVAFGRPKMAFHEMRHFCATYLLELGLTPADVAVQLGHTDGGALVMSTYGHPSQGAARARIRTALDGHDSGELRAFRDRRAG